MAEGLQNIISLYIIGDYSVPKYNATHLRTTCKPSNAQPYPQEQKPSGLYLLSSNLNILKIWEVLKSCGAFVGPPLWKPERAKDFGQLSGAERRDS